MTNVTAFQFFNFLAPNFCEPKNEKDEEEEAERKAKEINFV